MARPSDSIVKRLFAVSGNQCAFPGCANALVDADSGVVTGKVCHARAQSPGGPRFVDGLSDSELHGFDNLLLMCPMHHDIIDARPDLHPIDSLLEAKRTHETQHAGGTESSDRVTAALLRNSGLLRELLDLTRAQAEHALDRDRPRFDAHQAAVTRLVSEFYPQWSVTQIAGDFMPGIEWRFRGPRFSMERQQALGNRLDSTNFAGTFNVSRASASDDLVGEDQLGFEIRFSWRGQWRIELHRYPLTFRAVADGRELCDVGGEILPPLYLG